MLGSKDEESNVKILPQKCGEGALEPGGKGAVPTYPFRLVPLTCEYRGSVLGKSSQCSLGAPPPVDQVFLLCSRPSSEGGICSQPRETLLLPEGPGLEPLWFPSLCSRRRSLSPQSVQSGCPPRRGEGRKPFFLPGARGRSEDSEAGLLSSRALSTHT